MVVVMTVKDYEPLEGTPAPVIRISEAPALDIVEFKLAGELRPIFVHLLDADILGIGRDGNSELLGQRGTRIKGQSRCSIYKLSV